MLFSIAINSIIELIIMLFYFNSILSTNNNKVIRIVGTSLLSIIYILKSFMNMSNSINLILSISITFFIAFVNYNDKFIKKIFTSLFYIFIIMASEIISSAVLSSTLSILYIDVPIVEKTKMALLTNILLLLIIIYLVKIPAKKIKDIPLNYWCMILIIPICSFFMVLIFDIITINSDIIYVTFFNIFIMIGLVYFNITIFYFFERYSDTIKLRETQAIIKNNKENYKILEKNEENLKILKHDIRKHINTIKEIAEEKSISCITQYANKLDNIAKTITSVTYTSNLILDTQLNIGAVKASELHIQYFVKTNIQSDIYIDDVDITTILYNSIENALEASKKTEEKYVVITINVYKTYIDIIIENPYTYLIEDKKKEIFYTTKIDKENHGLGILSIKNAVNRYNGSINMHQENNVNSLIIHINNIKNVSFTL